jgi:ABC-type uncharacterized transport system auxiliary subunit
MIARRAGIASLLLITAGCGVMGKADAPVTLRLAPIFETPIFETPAFGTAAVHDPRSVSVASPDAAPTAARTRYAYVDPARPGEVNQARTLFWEEPPPRALGRALVQALRTRFGSATGPEVSMPADLRVLPVLDRFEELSGNPGRAIVAFEATVIEHGKVARAGSWCASATFTGTSPGARAQAFEAALVSATGAFVQDLAAGTAPTSAGSC